MIQYPNLICVGPQKAGTGWQHDQLRSCDQFWCPPIKELNYFTDRFLQPVNQRKIAASVKGLNQDGGKLDTKDSQFYECVRSFKGGKPNSLDEYKKLFSFAEGRLNADISPS